eukprot:g11241.t1
MEESALDSQPGWVRSQARAFAGWLNAHLTDDEKVRLSHLNEDLASGVVLHSLLRSMEPKYFTAKCNVPSNKFKKIENFQTLLEFLKTKQTIRVELDPYTLVDPQVNLKSLLALCYQLIVCYSVSPSQSAPPTPVKQGGSKNSRKKKKRKSKKKLDGKEALLAWVSDKAGQNVTDFEHAWSDGLLFCDLVHALVPEADVKRFKPKAKEVKANCLHAFQLAERHLGVPQLLDADLIAEGVVDDQSIHAYVSLLQRFATGDKRCKSPASKDAPTSPPRGASRVSLPEGTPVQIHGYVKPVIWQADFSYRVDGWKKLSLHFSCRSFSNQSQLGQSDPLLAVFERADLSLEAIYDVPLTGQGWRLVGETEWLKGDNEVKFQKPVSLFYNSHQAGDVEYKCALYDVQKQQVEDADAVGYAFVSLSSLISACVSGQSVTFPLLAMQDQSDTGSEVTIQGTAQNVEAPAVITPLAQLASQFQSKFGSGGGTGVEWLAAIGSLQRPELCSFAHSPALNMKEVSAEVATALDHTTHLLQARQRVSYGVCTAPRRLLIVQEEIARLKRDIALVKGGQAE